MDGIVELARITSKGQLTVPKKVREAARLVEGDVVTFVVEGDRVIMRKLPLGEDAYLRGIQDTLTEWQSPEDEDAWSDL